MKKLVIRAWPLLPIVILFIIPALCKSFHTVEAISVEGTVYQVFGIMVVIFSLDEKLKYFRGVSLLGNYIQLCKDIWHSTKSIWPWKTPQNTKIQGTAIGGRAIVSGNVTVIQQINHLPIQEQLEWLKKKVDEVSMKIDENNNNMQSQKKELEKNITSVKTSIEMNIATFNNKLGNFMTGSIPLEFVGTVCLVVGVVFGTIPWWVASLYKN